MAPQGADGLVRLGKAGMAWCGGPRRGKVWRGKPRHGEGAGWRKLSGSFAFESPHLPVALDSFKKTR